MRAEPGMPGLTYQLISKERLVVVLPSDHRLASLSYRQILVTAWPVTRRRLWADGQSVWR
jgi:hypothetical protein